ncbi:MAG TPA: flavin reductase, partial [Lachnospiraceae bacterium]|nr:flavin reductase [Lachnospiraceae bacterium]
MVKSYIAWRIIMDDKALFKLASGLFLLTAKTDKDNGCIINTVLQVTASPIRIVTVVNKNNYTHNMIKETGNFNVSVLSETAPMDLYKKFGYASGRDTDKFNGYSSVVRSENGLLYLTEYSNAYISGKVIEEKDLGTHTLFIADVTAAQVLSDTASATYEYYQKNVKPAPEISNANNSGFICTIC